MSKLGHLILSVLIPFVLSGCVTTSPLRQEHYYWPPPPNPPRIEWLAAYRSQLDLQKTGWRRFKEVVVGEDDALALTKPVEVRAEAGRNKIYVADLGARAVFVFDLRQNEMRKLSTSGSNLPEAILPMSLALDRVNNLYVLEPRLNQVLVFDHDENLTRSIKLGKFCKRPIALAIDKQRERLYVSDAQLNMIFAMDLKGNFLFSIGNTGDSAETFNRPVSMTVNTRGEIIVADAFNARIQVFNEQGVFLRTFGKRGDGISDFQLIKSVAVDSDDNIYVVDGRSHNIKIFNQTGDPLLTLGGFYAVSSSGKLAPGGFAVPIGIDIDSKDRIFIVDQINARLQVFQYLSNKSKGGLPTLPAPQQAK